ncbi:hypothetical protein HG535_0A05240 [Zygotorulaspora mrakii]|uniref:FAS1 domain-containing protein n=1 Tax=Zygotorulaspora mrakii TaxID=42260 RepID=A0A7H9AWH9_ZYGMR|nr:uncharacterized protein HG535_0A05240 [Zygotorulaspora mrakii]QLG70583.1 hypothetical protein HG535_0A05240 [Zygotorulaspora mrakii]
MIFGLYNGLWNQSAMFLSSLLLWGILAHGGSDFPFTTVVDILSENVEFSTFLRILQRQGCVPILNELQNYTLLAPVNSAFINMGTNESSTPFVLDNFILRNNVLSTSLIDDGITVIDCDVRFPLVLQKSVSSGSTLIKINEATIVDPDLAPSFQSATVHGISDLINDPPLLIDFLQDLEGQTGEFSLFEKFVESLTSDNIITDMEFYNNTILIPSNINFHRYFNQLEINYILDNFSKLDSVTGNIRKAWEKNRLNFFRNLILRGVHGGVHSQPESTENLNNDKISFESNDFGSSISVNDSELSIDSNIVFDRGIIHSFNDIPFLSKATHFNAETYLHGMNSSDFVQELYFRNLQKMLEDESLDVPLTIFVPETSLNEKFGYTKSNLLYHFIENQLWLEEEFLGIKSSTKMFESAFCSSNKRLGGNCQRLRIKKNLNGYIINDKYKILHNKPFEIGKTLIYTISEVLQLPGDFVPSLNPFYHCSKSLELLRKINLLDLPPNQEGYTILLPCFESWSTNGLDLEYLRRNLTAIELMMKNMILEGLIYTDSEDINLNTKNMFDQEISISVRTESSADSEKVFLNLSSVRESIETELNMDVFFNQGVIHPISKSYFPNDLSITLGDLIETTGTTAFIDFLNFFDDFNAVLSNNDSYSLLVPTKNSLRIDGIDKNFTSLHQWLELHVIPGNATSDLLECGNQINTTSGEPLTCRESSPGNYLLKLKNGNDNEVRILKKGCTSFDMNSCVFLIDRPISLQWLSPNKYHLKLPGVAIGIGIVLGAISVLALLFCILVVFVGRNHGTKVGEQPTDTEDNAAARPLLSANNAEPNSLAGSNDYQRRRFESAYSSNSSRKPIDVSTVRTSVNPV